MCTVFLGNGAMANTEWIGREATHGHDLYLLELGSPEDLPAQLWIASPRFRCVVVWDARHVDEARIVRFAKRLLDAGAVSICSCGEDCGRVRDFAGGAGFAHPWAVANGKVVVATAHEEGTIEDALFTAIDRLSVDDGYIEGSNSVVAVVIGSEARAAEARGAMMDWCSGVAPANMFAAS
jgi:hypothetical protein